MSHKYSITPEGAALAAKEIAELVSNAKFTVRSFTAQTFANTSAAIILRHAEQSSPTCQQARKTLESSSRTDVRTIGATLSARVEQAGSSSEGEMREACIVCGCALMPPERTEPPHCMDCALTDEHYYAWEAGKGV